jgi:Tfp pilus assembly protein PilF
MSQSLTLNTTTERARPTRSVAFPRPAPAVVALAALLAFGGTLAYDFVWDDTLLIRRSYQLHDWRLLPSALSSHFWAETQEASHYYRPLVTLSFFLDLQVWGLKPLGFHLTNVVVHLVTALAVLALARRITGSEVAAGAAGLLFALHPLHSESVAFVSGRSDVLATLLFVLALLGYARWKDGTGRAALGGSLLAFFLALTAKEVAVTLPVALALYDWARPRAGLTPRSLTRTLGGYVPYAAVIAAYTALRVAAIGGLVERQGAAWADLSTRVLTGVDIVAHYARLVLIPFPANAYPAIIPVTAPPDMGWWLRTTFLAVAVAATIVVAHRSRRVGFGALWFWLTLVPFAGVNVLAVSAPILAERFLYLPSVGVCLMLGMAASRVLGDVKLWRSAQVRAAPALAVVGLLLVFAVLTLWRNEHWKDDERLFSRMVETTPNMPLPLVNLAFTVLPRGDVAHAQVLLRRAVELAPTNARALAGLALVDTVLGDRESGLRYALAAEALALRQPDVLATLGAVYLFREEPAQAVTHLQASLALRGEQVQALLNLALALSRLGRDAEALPVLDRGIRLSALMNPGDPHADRVAAEVLAQSAPEKAAVAWERYIERLRLTSEPTARHRHDLAYAERELARLRSQSL